MGSRLTGIVATLWFFIAILSLFVALVLSPMGLRLLLPGSSPVTWVYPALLTIPPVALACQKYLGRSVSAVLLWLIAISLSAFALLLFALLATTFLGN